LVVVVVVVVKSGGCIVIDAEDVDELWVLVEMVVVVDRELFVDQTRFNYLCCATVWCC
jgi:hypothetical protein